MKKQAQQPSSGKGSGLRPLDASLSGITRKPEDPSKSSTPSDCFPGIFGHHRHLGKCDHISKAVDSTRQLHNAPCDADPLSTSRRAIHTKPALPVLSSNTRTQSIFSISGDCATQSSSISRSSSLFRPAQQLSTRASIGQSPLGPCIIDEASEYHPGVLPRPSIPLQHQALPASDPPYRRSVVSSSLISQTPTSAHDGSGYALRTCLPLEFHTQASTDMYAQELSVIEMTSTGHDVMDELDAFPTSSPQGAQTKLSEACPPQPREDVLFNVEPRPRSLSVVAVSASQAKADLPVLTHQRINVISYCALACMVIIIPARSSGTGSECLPAMSRTRMEKPPRFTPVHRRAPTPGLPTPEPKLVGASCLSLPRAGESAYDHPALRPSIDDDAEWSTLPKRKPPAPAAQSKNSITSSAKFLLPTRTRAPSPTGSRGAETGKRPRITLYRPPPRTAAIDLAGLESRYACVRSAMRKVGVL